MGGLLDEGGEDGEFLGEEVGGVGGFLGGDVLV